MKKFINLIVFVILFFIAQKISSQSQFTSVFFANEQTGWVTSHTGGFYKTTNCGINWFFIQGTINTKSCFFINTNTGWTASDYGSSEVCKTTNGGLNWAHQFYFGFLQSVFFVDSNIGWTVGYNGYLFKTTNGGYNWINQSGGSMNSFCSVFFINSNTGWISGLMPNYCIWLKTTNGGTNWIQNSSNVLPPL